MSTPFNTAYASLNAAQRDAVDTIDGPVLVLAGPGTGKTQVLSLRIGNILQKTDTAPQSILALTFTDSAAITMRKRLAALIGPTAFSVRIMTFHSLASQLISQYPEAYPFSQEFLPASDLERHSILRKILDSPNLVTLRTPGSKYHYLPALLSTISHLKTEGISPEELLEQIENESCINEEDTSRTTLAAQKAMHQDAKMREIALVYSAYQEALRSAHRLDFDDMIFETVSALRTQPQFAQSVEESIQYLLVDEFQDTNGAQNKILDLLTATWGDQANLFVVGDPNQTIFRFQGASLENTYGFIQRFPHARVIGLQEGYRCPPSVYSAAAAIITPTTTDASKISLSLPDLQSVKRDDQLLQSVTMTTLQEEHAWIARVIQEQKKSGDPYHATAILVKTNAETSRVAKDLHHFGIPTRVERPTNVLETDTADMFILLLAAIAEAKSGNDDGTLYRLFSYPWMGIDPLALMQVTRAVARSTTHKTIRELINAGEKHLTTLADTKSLAPTAFQSLQEVLEKIDRWSVQASTMTLPSWLEIVVNESGLLAYLLHQENMPERLLDLHTLYDDAKRAAAADHSLTAANWYAMLVTMREQSLPLLRSEKAVSEDAVTISTVHSAKGREWKTVILPHFLDGTWGNARKRSSLPLPAGIMQTVTGDTGDADERRLLYVAMTRTTNRLIFTGAMQEQSGGKLKERLPSGYLLMLPSETLLRVDAAEVAIDPKDLQALVVPPKILRTWQEEQREWLKELTKSLPLSVSTLNTYLRSPQEFFENVLLRVPRAKAAPMAFGTAVHTALESHYRTYSTHEQTHPPIEATLAVFERALNREVLHPDDHTVRLRQGKKILEAYLQERRQHFPQIVSTEEGFGWKRGKLLLADIELTGKVDRIDRAEQNDQHIIVVDYKTGKPKTQNEIEGIVGTQHFSDRELSLPTHLRGPYKRQLLFYKLLLSLDPLYRNFVVHEGIFDFVEGVRGAPVERRFQLDQSHVDDLADLIREVMEEIRSLKFLDQVE